MFARLWNQKSIKTLGMLGCVALCTLGCASGGNSASATPKKTNKDLSAPEAWKKLEDEGRGMSFLGGVTDILIGNKSNTSVGSLLTKGQQDAEKRLDEAMAGDLPGKAIAAMVDEVAQSLVTDLAEIPEVKAASYQHVLAFGNIDSGKNDETNQALDELKAKLFENAAVTNTFYIVSSTEADSNAVVKKIAGGDLSVFRDPLQRTPDETKAKSFDPKLIYMVNGKITPNKEKAKRTISITMNWRVEKLIDRALVKNYSFTRNYMWHPYRNDWEIQP